MKNITCFILLFVLISNTYHVDAQKIKDKSNFILKKDDPDFMIKFSAAFKLEESEEVKGLKTELFRSEIGEEVYMLKYTEHKNPAVSSDNEVYMDASLESFITGIKASLIKQSEFKYNKGNGLEAFLSLDDKNMNVFYRVLIIDRVQYQLIVITKEDEKTLRINNFFNSFICPVNK